MTLELTAPPASPGGPGSAGFTQGSVVFADANGRLNQDNATNYFDGTNKVLILGPRGTYAPTTGELHVVDTTANSVRGIVNYQASADTGGARDVFRKSRGTPSAPAVVVTGDTLGNHIFEGYDGANFLQMASVQAVAEGTIASTRVPTRLVFSTATDAAPSVLTEAMRIDSAQRVGIGATPTVRLDVAETGNAAIRGLASRQASADTGGASVLIMKSRGTPNAPATISVNDNYGSFEFYGHDGTAFIRSALIAAVSVGTVATNRMPSRLDFYTATDASPSVITKRMLIDQSGSVVIGAAVSNTPLDGGGGLTVYGAASQKTVVLRTNATSPGSAFEIQNSGGTVKIDMASTGHIGVTANSGTVPFQATAADGNASVFTVTRADTGNGWNVLLAGDAYRLYSGAGNPIQLGVDDSAVVRNATVVSGTSSLTGAGGLTVYGAASQKTAVFRANATTPGNVLETQDSGATPRITFDANGFAVFGANVATTVIAGLTVYGQASSQAAWFKSTAQWTGSSTHRRPSLELSSQTLNFVTTAQTGDVSSAYIDQLTVTSTPASTVIPDLSGLRIKGPITSGANASATRTQALLIETGADANFGLVVRQNSGTQSGRLIQFQNSAGAELSYVSQAGVFAAPAGSTGTAAFGFQAESTLGIYRISSGILGFTANAELARMSSSLFQLAAGVMLTLNQDASAAQQIVAGTTNGLQIATSTSQKLAWHGATPVIQRAGAAQAAVATTAATNITPFGFSTAAQADAIVTLVNEIRAALVEKGLIKGSA